MHTMSGKQIVHAMRVHKVTIRSLAKHMNVTQKRVREVREHGVTGQHFCRDWTEGISDAGTSIHTQKKENHV